MLLEDAEATVAAACSLPGEKNTVVAVSELGRTSPGPLSSVHQREPVHHVKHHFLGRAGLRRVCDASAAAVGSLTMRKTSRPATRPATRVYSR